MPDTNANANKARLALEIECKALRTLGQAKAADAICDYLIHADDESLNRFRAILLAV